MIRSIEKNRNLKLVLKKVENIALIGASSNKKRDSYKVMNFLINNGYKVFPVNPNEINNTILGEKCYSRLCEIKDSIDEWGQSADTTVSLPGALSMAQEAIDGLIALGYKPQDASKFIRQVEADGMTSGDMIKAALKEVASV